MSPFNHSRHRLHDRLHYADGHFLWSTTHLSKPRVWSHWRQHKPPRCHDCDNDKRQWQFDYLHGNSNNKHNQQHLHDCDLDGRPTRKWRRLKQWNPPDLPLRGRIQLHRQHGLAIHHPMRHPLHRPHAREPHLRPSRRLHGLV